MTYIRSLSCYQGGTFNVNKKFIPHRSVHTQVPVHKDINGKSQQPLDSILVKAEASKSHLAVHLKTYRTAIYNRIFGTCKHSGHAC